MDRLYRFAVASPRLVVLATLLITAGFAAILASRGVAFNGSPQTLARDDDTLRFYQEIRDQFGDERVIVAAWTADDVFTPAFLSRLDRVSRQLAAVPGVAEVIGLTNIQAVRRAGDDVVVERLIPSAVMADAEALGSLKRRVITDPLYASQYVSTDGRTAAVSVFLNAAGEQETRQTVLEIERIAEAFPQDAGRVEAMLAGVPIMEARGISRMTRDMLVISPLAALLCLLVFLFTFRSFWGAALPMLSLLIGVVWTLGVMSLCGRPVTLATLSLPTVLMAVGSSYIFHVLNQHCICARAFDEKGGAAQRRSVWLEGLRFIGPAVIVSAATTMAGFGALASSSVPTVRDMGVFEALGVLFMLALSIVFVPAALCLLPAHALGHFTAEKADYAVWLNGALRQVTALILYRRRRVLGVALIGTLAVGAGTIWLRANTDYLGIFPPQSETVRDAENLRQRLAGGAIIQIILSGPQGSVTEPAFLKAADELGRFAAAQPGVDAALSVADIVRRMDAVLNGQADGAGTIPEDGARLRSIFDDFLFQDDAILRLVNADRSRAVIVLRTGLFSSSALRGLTERLDAWSRDRLPQGVTARVTGSLVLLNDASDAVAASQISSLAIALVSIYLMMVVLFRSFATGLLALVPNLLPVVMYFGFLGWAGIPLDMTTSLVASAVLGLAVDNAVHMIRRYRQSVGERAGAAADEGWAMWLTIHRTGKPMALANLMLMGAFLLFLLTSFVPVRLAGQLWALAIFACLIADLIFLPALMTTGRFRRAALGRPVQQNPQPAPVDAISSGD